MHAHTPTDKQRFSLSLTDTHTHTHRHILTREGRGNERKRGGRGGLAFIFNKAFLAFVPRPNAVTTLS